MLAFKLFKCNLLSPALFHGFRIFLEKKNLKNMYGEAYSDDEKEEETKTMGTSSSDIEKMNIEEDIKSRSNIEREQWSLKLDYILSMLGYSVGLGNLWRFPYLCMRNGGGAFLIPFIFFLTACGLPLYFLEVSLGQFMGKGAVHVWEICPLFKGIGVGMMVALSVYTLYCNIIIAWTLYYLRNSFISPLPWSTCGNEWNTARCIEDRSVDPVEMLNQSITHNVTLDENSSSIYYDVSTSDAINYTAISNGSADIIQGMIAEEEFWQFNVLHLSNGLHEIGGIPWHLPVCFLTAWILVYLCLIRGVKSLGKVVYVTAGLPYMLLVVMLVRGLTLPGSLDGIMFYIKPDFDKLFKIQTWVEAGLHISYSLGAVWGPLITMSSYNKFDNNCYRDSLILTFISEGTSIFGGFAIFSILGFMAFKANIPVSDVVKSGPGLGFMTYPEAISQLPLSNLWAVLFFFMLLMVGLDSQFACVEVCCTAIMDSYPALRKKRQLLLAIVCVFMFLPGICMCTEGGLYIFQLLDWYIGSLCVPIFALLECIIFGWIYGAEKFSRDIQHMIGRTVPVYMRILWCFITPVLMAAIFIFTLATYKPPTYGNYVYPGYAQVFGWMVAFLPVIPLPIFAVIALNNTDAPTLTERFRICLKPTTKWTPVKREEGVKYPGYSRESRCGIVGKIRMNILGHE